MDALLRRRTMIAFGGGEPPTPPEPPVMVPYIRGGADGSYIDTGIAPDTTTKIVVWARNFNPSKARSYLFGCQYSSGDKRMFNLYTGSTTSTGAITVAYGTATGSAADKYTLFSHYHKYELDANVLSVDDVQVLTITTDTMSTSYRNIHLFGLNNNNSTHDANDTPIDICACKIYKNGVLVRDLTPVESPSVGFYDAISDTVFTNPGNGTLIYGEFDKNAYVPLEYISCNASQYFDTGVYGSYSLPLVCKIMPTSTTAAWRDVMGLRISSPALYCDVSLGTATSGQDNMRLYLRLGENDTSVTVFGGSSSNKLTNKGISVVKDNAKLTVYYNGAQAGTGTKSGVSTSFTSSPYTMIVGGSRRSDSTVTYTYIGNIYFVGFGGQKNFVPAKVGNVAGMYDTYNDAFKSSETTTAFVAGPELNQ